MKNFFYKYLPMIKFIGKSRFCLVCYSIEKLSSSNASPIQLQFKSNPTPIQLQARIGIILSQERTCNADMRAYFLLKLLK